MHGRQIEFYSRFSMALVAIFVAAHAWQADPVSGRLVTVAQAADPDKKPAGDSKDEDKPDAEAEDAAKLYTLPDSNKSADLLKFIEKIRKYRPETVEAAVEHQKRAPLAVKAAAERILKVEKDKSSEAYRTASLMLLASQVSALDDSKPAEQRAVIDEVVKRISVPEPSDEDLSIAMMVARKLDGLEDTKIAAEGYSAIAKAFKASKQKQVAEVGAMFEGAARRIDLVGKPMKVDGKTVAGKNFDWKAYRGKVVLVDFWATWCGPCRAELPNVRRAYQEYHNRGFDVVGVSIDDETDKLEHFLAEESLPWVTLHDVDKAKEGGHPLAEYYGIMGIPTVILVGKDGNVVSLAARGDELWEQLAKLLGPPAKDKAAADEPAAKAAAAAKPATPLQPAKPVVGAKPKGAAK